MISDALKKHKEEAAPPPDRADARTRDSAEYRLGYRLGFHDAMEDAIEIAEEEEDS